MKDADAIIVGAGISGLLSALALAKEGKKVLVLEKDGQVGGNARSYTVKDFQVDTGPHAVTYIQDGPLARLMNEYFDVKPVFLPYGTYYVRDKEKLEAFPWTLMEWMRFSILPKKDRLELAHMIASAIASSPLKKAGLDMTVAEFVGKRGFSDKTWKFIDALCYFMCGKPMDEAPAWRMLKGARYLEESEDTHIRKRVKNVLKLKKLVSYNGAYHQAYPKAGVQAITDALLYSLPEKRVSLQTGEAVTGLDFSGGKVAGVTTQDSSYNADFVVYSGMVKALPHLAGEMLPKAYAEELNKIQVTTSITLWLGLSKPHKSLGYLGSEIWFEEGKPYWGMPTSNYNPAFAPGGRQVVGFTTFVDGQVNKEKKALEETVYSAIPGIEKLSELTHFQVTNPEKAAVTAGVRFPKVKSPLNGLYLVGTDTDMRSMGLTRAAFSVETLVDTLRKEKKIR
ncbi:MAG: NAD(P)/FAD-dependent oxidoreductase [Candidatus Altiarchaeota archaeon]